MWFVSTLLALWAARARAEPPPASGADAPAAKDAGAPDAETAPDAQEVPAGSEKEPTSSALDGTLAEQPPSGSAPVPEESAPPEGPSESSSSARPRISGSLHYEVFAREFNPLSALNPQNLLDVPSGFHRYGLKLRASSNFAEQLRVLGDTYLQMRTEFHHSRPTEIVAAAYLLQLNATWFASDTVSVRIGKHLGNIGTSLSELVLIPYRVYADRRQNEGVNVIDDEGYWGAVANVTTKQWSFHLDYLPPHWNGPSELTNINQVHAVQAVVGTTLFGVDAKLQLYDELDAFKPFVAMALSYAPRWLPKLTLAVDAAIVNHKDKVVVDRTAMGPVLRIDPVVYRPLSPVLAGVGYGVADWLLLKVEWLYDGYALSRDDSRSLFQWLAAHPEQVPVAASFWRRNVFSRHYLLTSVLLPRLWERIDVFVGYRESLTDYSAQIVGSVALSVQESARIELEFMKVLWGGRWSEYPNGFLDQQLGLKGALFF